MLKLVYAKIRCYNGVLIVAKRELRLRVVRWATGLSAASAKDDRTCMPPGSSMGSFILRIAAGHDKAACIRASGATLDWRTFTNRGNGGECPRSSGINRLI